MHRLPLAPRFAATPSRSDRALFVFLVEAPEGMDPSHEEGVKEALIVTVRRAACAFRGPPASFGIPKSHGLQPSFHPFRSDPAHIRLLPWPLPTALVARR